MSTENILLYKKAYVELYYIISLLSKEEQSKIPPEFINYINDNKDQNYSFYPDLSKELLEQEYMIETKALLVNLYETYLAPESEKEFWEKYDKVCSSTLEEEKRKDFQQKNTLETFQETDNEEVKINSIETNILEYKESFFSKIKNFIKNLLKTGK